VAEQLGLKETAVRTRLSRARKLLERRLTRRGIELTALLCGVALSQGSAKAAPGLVKSTIKAAAAFAAGQKLVDAVHSASVITLMEGMKSPMLSIACKIVIPAMLLTGAMGLGFAAFPQAPPPAPPQATAANQSALIAQPAGQADETIVVTGRVLDPAGMPAAGARVAVLSTTHWETRLSRRPVVEVTSDGQGRFRLTYRKSQVSPFSTGGGSSGVESWKQTQIVASHPGYGLAFDRWNNTDAQGELVLRLVEDDVPIEGRIVDLEGRPVAGVRVTVSHMMPLDDRVLREAAKRDPAGYSGSLLLWMPFSSAGIATPITTDRDGRFRIIGVGRDRKVTCYIQGATIGFAKIEAGTQVMASQTKLIDQPIGTTDKAVTYGAKFEHTAVPGRTVQGVITDAGTGKPIAGVVVKSQHFAPPFQGYDPDGMLQSVTDAQGLYKLNGFPKGSGNGLSVNPNDDQPYFSREEGIEDTPGLGPITLNVDLHRGVWVTGKVTDKATGQPVAARICYTTYLDNEHTFKIPAFHREGGMGHLEGSQLRYESKSDGTYRVVAVPGKAVIGVWCPSDRYCKGVGFEDILAYKKKESMSHLYHLYQMAPYREGTNSAREVVVPVGADNVVCDLQLDPGLSLQVNVTGPDGQPAKGPFQVRGYMPENYVGWHHQVIKEPTFEAIGFGPKDSRTIYVLDEVRQLGRVVTVKFSEVKGRPLSISLQPLAHVSARLLTPQGDPLAGISVAANAQSKQVRDIESDAEGRIRTTVMPGSSYHLHVDRGPYVGRAVGKEFNPAPGSTIDLGDVKLERQRQE
jgi:hypothetical protein